MKLPLSDRLLAGAGFVPKGSRVADIGCDHGYLGIYLLQNGINFLPGWGANFPNAFNGFAPHGASESIGKAFAQIAAERLAGIYKLLKEDEDCVRMVQGLPKLD